MKDKQSAEGFCNMVYVCEHCHTTDMIWNSRDGVTPFMLSCLACEGTMKHSGNWRLEKEYTELPDDATRVFVDAFESGVRAIYTEWANENFSKLQDTYDHFKNVTIEEFIEEKIKYRMKDQCPLVITRQEYLDGVHNA